jgi:hypothetical protein
MRHPELEATGAAEPRETADVDLRHHQLVGRRVQIAIDCADTEALAIFWAEVLNYRLGQPPQGFASWPEFSRAVAVDPGKQWSRLVDPTPLGPTCSSTASPRARSSRTGSISTSASLPVPLSLSGERSSTPRRTG